MHGARTLYSSLHILKSWNLTQILTQFFACLPTFYKGPISYLEHGVSDNSNPNRPSPSPHGGLSPVPPSRHHKILSGIMHQSPSPLDLCPHHAKICRGNPAVLLRTQTVWLNVLLIWLLCIAAMKLSIKVSTDVMCWWWREVTFQIKSEMRKKTGQWAIRFLEWVEWVSNKWLNHEYT